MSEEGKCPCCNENIVFVSPGTVGALRNIKVCSECGAVVDCLLIRQLRADLEIANKVSEDLVVEISRRAEIIEKLEVDLEAANNEITGHVEIQASMDHHLRERAEIVMELQSDLDAAREEIAELKIDREESKRILPLRLGRIDASKEYANELYDKLVKTQADLEVANRTIASLKEQKERKRFSVLIDKDFSKEFVDYLIDKNAVIAFCETAKEEG